ncbi:MAG: thioredoxin [Acidobacteria bacterium]|nr:thioredoxin [Acidobacteriota bacterium]
MQNRRRIANLLKGTPLPDFRGKKSMPGNSSIVAANDETFHAVVAQSDLPVVVDFWAPWCAPCRNLAAAVEELAGEYSGRVKFVKVNVNEGQRTAMSLGVLDLPTIILFDHGNAVSRQVGAQPKAALNDMVNHWLTQSPDRTLS